MMHDVYSLCGLAVGSSSGVLAVDKGRAQGEEQVDKDRASVLRVEDL